MRLHPRATEHPANRINTRSPFDRNVCYQPELIEHVLDHVFSSCGVQGASVAHPVVMTEPVCCPPQARAQMAELLFECYRTPAVCFGVDALFSYHHNVASAHVPAPRVSLPSASSSASSSSSSSSAAVLVSCGWQACHVLPVIDGRALFDRAHRLDVGGAQAHDFLQRSMQLKYPQHRFRACD